MDDPTDFSGFGPAAFDWLDQLAADNSRAFFEASRATFDAEVRQPFGAMLSKCARDTRGRARVFRQLRDLRFAANQERPYWPTVAGEITGRAETSAALIADLSSDGLTAMAGHRRPFSRDQLSRYRAAVDDLAAGHELQQLVAQMEDRGIVLHGATLRGVPRGFPADHEHLRLLRHTALYAGATLGPTVRRRRGRADLRRIPADAALEHLTLTWAHLAHLMDWLDRFVGPANPDAAATAA